MCKQNSLGNLGNSTLNCFPAPLQKLTIEAITRKIKTILCVPLECVHEFFSLYRRDMSDRLALAMGNSPLNCFLTRLQNHHDTSDHKKYQNSAIFKTRQNPIWWLKKKELNQKMLFILFIINIFIKGMPILLLVKVHPVKGSATSDRF